jgi:SNF2 family DNA or RNA helicase
MFSLSSSVSKVSSAFRQNNIEELYSLIKFLRVKPLNDFTKFKDQIAKPLKNGRGASRAMRRLQVSLMSHYLLAWPKVILLPQVVLEKIMLRRQKDQILNGEPILILPARNVNIVHCEFDETEQAFYGDLETKMDAAVNKLMQQEQTNYMSVLLLLLRLRQGALFHGRSGLAFCDVSHSLQSP